MKRICTIILILLWAGFASGDDLLPKSITGAVYGIINYGYHQGVGDSIKYGVGNGLVMCDSTLGVILVTCRHMIESQPGVISDSIAIKDRLEYGQYYCALDCGLTVYLKRNGNIYYDLPYKRVDLAIVRLTEDNMPVELLNKLIALPVELLESSPCFPFANSHAVLLSYSNEVNEVNCLNIKFGRYVKEDYTVRTVSGGDHRIPIYITTDIPAKSGDSGAPVFSYYNDRICVIGIHHANNRTYSQSFEIPAALVVELLATIKAGKTGS